jgi:hypothetical protein
MHAFHGYLGGQLAPKLKQQRGVMCYDPQREFAPYINDLSVPEVNSGPVLRVHIGEVEARVARFEGSYFALRLVEKILRFVRADEYQELLLDTVQSYYRLSRAEQRIEERLVRSGRY